MSTEESAADANAASTRSTAPKDARRRPAAPAAPEPGGTNDLDDERARAHLRAIGLVHRANNTSRWLASLPSISRYSDKEIRKLAECVADLCAAILEIAATTPADAGEHAPSRAAR